MTDEPVAAGPGRPIDERVGFAIRQAALLVVGLAALAVIVDELRPIGAPNRDFFATPFVWTAVLWVTVLLVHAVAFDQPVLDGVEAWPLRAAGVLAGALLVAGVVRFDHGSAGERFAYLAANAIGSLMFWWAVLSLAWLAIRAVAQSTD